MVCSEQASIPAGELAGCVTQALQGPYEVLLRAWAAIALIGRALPSWLVDRDGCKVRNSYLSFVRVPSAALEIGKSSLPSAKCLFAVASGAPHAGDLHRGSLRATSSKTCLSRAGGGLLPTCSCDCNCDCTTWNPVDCAGTKYRIRIASFFTVLRALRQQANPRMAGVAPTTSPHGPWMIELELAACSRAIACSRNDNTLMRGQ